MLSENQTMKQNANNTKYSTDQKTELFIIFVEEYQTKNGEALLYQDFWHILS